MNVVQGKTILNLTETEIKAISDFYAIMENADPFVCFEATEVLDLMEFITRMPMNKPSANYGEDIVINIVR